MSSSVGLDILNSMGASTFNVKNMATVLANADVTGLRSNLAAKETLHADKLSGFDLLNRALEGFKTQVADITKAATFNKMGVTSSDPSVLTASLSGDVIPGSYSVEVQQLAQAHTLASTNTFTSMNTEVGEGDLTINVGGVSHTITIDSNNHTLAGIQDAINAADIGVMATSVNTGNGYKLMMTSSQTGASNQIDISVANDGDGDDGDNAGLSQLVTANMQETVAAQDAAVVINGLTVNSASNKLSGVISGVDINLLSANVGQTNQLDISRDTSEIAQKVTDYVDLFNSLDDIFKNVTSYSKDPNASSEDEAKKAGADLIKGTLPGSSIVRMMKDQMRSVLQTQITGLSGSIQSMADIGVTSKIDGTLTLDKSKLDAAIAVDPVSVGRLFAANGTTTDTFVKFTGSNDKTIEGTYDIDVTTAASHGSVTGDATGNADSFTITAGDNDTLKLEVDGNSSATLTLAAGTYTGDELAQEIMRVVNNDTDLSAKNAKLSVSYDAGADKFTFDSDLYGSASKVKFTDGTVLGDLGLASGDEGTGEDVGGQLTNADTGEVYTFTGVGQHVKVSDYAGDNLPKGLEFDIGGSATGDRGSLTFNRGYADKLSQLFSTFQTKEGLLGQQLEKLNEETSQLAEQKTAIDTKFDALELKYRIKFGALQSILSGMAQTRSTLAATFNNSNNN